jgi:hypothetical protein
MWIEPLQYLFVISCHRESALQSEGDMIPKLLIPVFLVFSLSVRPIFADKYESFDDLDGTMNHGWSLYSATSDFEANVTPTSRAGGPSGPGELEINVAAVPFLQSAYFADTHLGGRFSLDEDFSFSGNLRLEGLDPGDEMQIVIGFFDSEIARHPTLFDRTPYVGIVIGSGYGGGGTYIEDGWIGAGNAWFDGGTAGGFLRTFDSQDAIPISMEFIAEREFGLDGNVAAKIGSESAGTELVNYQNDHPTFDAFGVLVRSSFFPVVTDLTIVLDDLHYSTATPEPASLALLLVACCCTMWFRRRRA